MSRIGEQNVDDAKLAEFLTHIDMVRSRSHDTYAALLGIDIRTLAATTIANDRKFTWYDMCYGIFLSGQEPIYSLANALWICPSTLTFYAKIK